MNHYWNKKAEKWCKNQFRYYLLTMFIVFFVFTFDFFWEKIFYYFVDLNDYWRARY